MVKDGLMESLRRRRGLRHAQFPGLPLGQFSIRPGPIMASTDSIDVEIEGRGAHAARPQASIDPIMVGAQMITALQSIVARNVDPVEAAVVSIAVFQAGTADNIIPQTAKLRGTARTLKAEVRELVSKRITEVVEGTARLHGATARLSLRRGYPVLNNHPRGNGLRRGRGRRGRRAGPGRCRHAAGAGRRGFRLHARGASGRVHFRRQWRHRGPPSSALQFQR